MKQKQWYYCQTPELFADPPFDEEKWCEHHSWLRHFPQPVIFFGVLKSLSPIIIWVIFVSTFVCVYAVELQPLGWPKIASTDYIQPFLLMSFAVSLLLVFRTNSSYARWWEARKVFGMQYHLSRDIARLVLAYIPEQKVGNELLRLDILLCAAMCVFINENQDYWLPVKDMLTEEELKKLNESKQPPVAIIQAMTYLVAKSSLSSYEKMALERRLSALDLCVGSCERISKQCIPLAYTRHTSRLLMTFCTFLPFGLWEAMSWLTIPVVAVMTFLLVGIENIGIQIEQPFYILPLPSFVRSTRKAVEEVAVQHKIAQSLLASVDGGSMN